MARSLDTLRRRKQRACIRRWKRNHREAVRRARRAYYLLHRDRERSYTRHYRRDQADAIAERRFRLGELSRRLEERALAEFRAHGLAIVGLRGLERPEFIFELRGRRTWEHFREPLPTW
jgi:hypothetical protein